MKVTACVFGILGLLLSVGAQEAKVEFERQPTDAAERHFQFSKVPGPRLQSTALKATFTLVDGGVDANSGGLTVLHDAKLPRAEDEPRNNFFFRAAADGGRLLVDLGQAIEIKRVASYSWHDGSRGPQVYKLFGAKPGGETNLKPMRPVDPLTCGWKALASVDTRPKNRDEMGGQYAVNIAAASGGSLGAFRYLLFDISQTENADAFGNTFFSEIEILEAGSPDEPAAVTTTASGGQKDFEAEGFTIRVDATDTPDLSEWALKKAGPMAQSWYPKLIKLLPSEGFEPSKTVNIVFDANMRGVAATSGARIRCAARWFSENLDGEALGAVFHEVVHVVQQYSRVPRKEGAVRPPGWLVEGIADYLRWYKFESDSRGAEIKPGNIPNAHYDASYRVTANFLHWVTEQHCGDLVPRLNTAIREGCYNESLWKELTGRELSDLGAEWKSALEASAAKSGPDAAAGK